ncbi:MAG: hypothetical protein C0485_18860 [Pirellula sp.]|nr:hypothetical protein [Pirellula sp.]
MLFAQRVFHVAGIYGLAVLLPQFFIELLPPEFVKQQLGEEIVPGAVHPEHFYGFIGVAAAWQVAFLIIARDPARYRLIMIPGILEKLSFGVAGLALFAAGRLTATTTFFGVIDLVWAALFFVAFRKVGNEAPDTV